MKLLKEALSPAIASWGVQHYWKKNYGKSFRSLQRARSWAPYLFEGDVFEACLGLSMYHLGDKEGCVEHLLAAKAGLSKVRSHDSGIGGLERETLNEVNEALEDLHAQ